MVLPQHSSSTPLALEGMKIVDCSQVLAGPFCTMLLADMGADVIKVEKPAGGDDTRHMGPPFVSGESAAFLAMNRNKRSIVLDFKQKHGVEAAKRLAKDADVMIENFRAGTIDRLGLGYEEMSAANPALIYCSISGFGRTGPYSRRGGYDLIAQGMSGLMSITGMPGSPPVKVGVPMADLNAGMFAAYGILSAYIHRLKTGKGQYLEVSLLESALAYMVWESGIYFTTGEVSRPLGSAHRLSAPYQSLKTEDGYINVGAPNDTNWARMVRTMGREDLLEDSRFTDNAGRMANRSDLEVELERTLTEHDTDHWLEKFDAAGFPPVPCLTWSRCGTTSRSAPGTWTWSWSTPLPVLCTTSVWRRSCTAHPAAWTGRPRPWANTRTRCWPRQATPRRKSRNSGRPAPQVRTPPRGQPVGDFVLDASSFDARRARTAPPWSGQ